ncbi:hypothetical protein MEX01_49770 [Methylorubrum extorquens]|nr:hypothetical protein MEX01_49770 [Methylorubrum extorquens]
MFQRREHIACSYADYAAPANPDVVKYLEGRGQLLSTGSNPLNVTYEMFVGKTRFGLSGYGLLRGDPGALQAWWLIPDIQLRLRDGHRLDLSITDLSGGTAYAEMTAVPKWLLRRARVHTPSSLD